MIKEIELTARENRIAEKEKQIGIDNEQKSLLYPSDFYLPIDSFLDYNINKALNISIRAIIIVRNAARNYNVDSFVELLEILQKKEDWLRLRNSGKKSVGEIAEYLETEYGIII